MQPKDMELADLGLQVGAAIEALSQTIVGQGVFAIVTVLVISWTFLIAMERLMRRH